MNIFFENKKMNIQLNGIETIGFGIIIGLSIAIITKFF